MAAQTRKLAKRKLDRVFNNLDSAKEHVNDVLAMGYHDYESQAQGLNMVYDAIEEVQKLTLRVNETI